ncbi:L-serine ammonia-lyase, iron-sulfur-dependent subunit beta [Anaeroselena agilis]|uniref:L-serine deaminase n=1 Tax=Anaeroselena agilis TaxID=3063788 RepID=A0ABU3P351_9FIRM|nr:L-serine ammonia-lyase, iron-sulfur-dependent subunit beta [Selenomonadales bacterium 4137-cl]
MRGLFDIAGPIMVGPSSSHTAGAVRLGAMARVILGERPAAAQIKLHGSFAQTCRGHGTDKALIGGLLGFAPDDERIKSALGLAADHGLKYGFSTVELPDVHPNTALIELTGVSGQTRRVVGASVGGGNILITSIDGYPVRVTGQYHTLITIHEDKPGVIAVVTKRLAEEGVNIAFMQVSRQERGEEALMVIEADEAIPHQALPPIRAVAAMKAVLAVPALGEGV